MEKTVLCIKNKDARQQYLAKMMIEEGYQVTLCEESSLDIEKYDVLLLPVASSKLNLKQISTQLRKGQKVFGGNFPAFFESACIEKKVEYRDYMKEDAIAIKNAVATAEGAIAEAIILGDNNLHGNKSIVLGYGRCAKVLADKLRGLQSQVTVYARNPVQRATAEAYGFYTISQIEAIQETEYGYIFNTIPALLLNKESLAGLKSHTVIIDIASGSGGVDFEYCKENGIYAKLCPGIPGKYAPLTSAQILFQYVIQNCK